MVGRFIKMPYLRVEILKNEPTDDLDPNWVLERYIIVPNENAGHALKAVEQAQNPNKNIRFISFHNDDPDLTRTACVIL